MSTAVDDRKTRAQVKGHSVPQLLYEGRPDARGAIICYLAVIPSFAIASILYLLRSYTDDPGFMPATFLIISIATLILAISQTLVFRSTRYSVTIEYVEIQTGIMTRVNRRIPSIFIRDVTVTNNFTQQWLGLGNVIVSASNGDSITLAEIRDPEALKELIWNRMVK
jgi:uncharacterized membrane protein YdbT with pleckstrin-like domain